MQRHEHSPETRGIVIGLKKAGWSDRKTTQETGVKKSTVNDIFHRYLTSGSTVSAPRSGRPTHISARDERHILADIEQNPDLPWVEYGAPYNVGRDGVRRIAHSAGLFKRIKRKKPFITEQGRTKRLKWAEENVDQAWERVLFTDETLMVMGETKGRHWTIRHIGEEYELKHILPTFRFKQKTLMVWGAIALDKKYPLKFIDYQYTEEDGKVVSTKGFGGKAYVEQIIEGHLQPLIQDLQREQRGEVLVLEDGAPAHTAKITQKARQRSGLVNITHPPYSPDLNPIENIWFILKQRVARIRPKATSPEILWEHVLIAWREIQQEQINQCIKSMPKRREAVIANNGWQTRW